MRSSVAKTVYGVLIGLGSLGAMGLKTWWLINDTAPAFWFWVIPIGLVVAGGIIWWRSRRERAQIARRIRRSVPDQGEDGSMQASD